MRNAYGPLATGSQELLVQPQDLVGVVLQGVARHNPSAGLSP